MFCDILAFSKRKGSSINVVAHYISRKISFSIIMYVLGYCQDNEVQVINNIYDSYESAFYCAVNHLSLDLKCPLYLTPNVHMLFSVNDTYSIDYRGSLDILKTQKNFFGYKTVKVKSYFIKQVSNPITDITELFAVMHV